MWEKKGYGRVENKRMIEDKWLIFGEKKNRDKRVDRQEMIIQQNV